MSKESVFRKISLDRLASPEQLDQLMQVTTPKGWVALIALVVLLLTAVVWGCVGRIPETVHGQGILVKSGGVLQVVPSAGGRVTDIAVSVGDLVSAGQIVARVAQPELTDQLSQALARLADLRAQRESSLAFERRDLALQTAALEQQRAAAEQSVASANESRRWLAQKIAEQEKLAKQGLITKQTLLATREQFNAAVQRASAGRGELAQIRVRMLSLVNDHDGEQDDARLRMEDAEHEVERLERELAERSEVTTPFTGRVLELMTEQGSMVASGEPILSLDLTGRSVKKLTAVLYVPSIEGKRIRVGMPVRIAPSTVKQEEFGMMLGRVTYVSDFPATTRGMARVLKNDQLVSVLSGSGAPYEVHADLTVAPETVSRYKWSSSDGPSLTIQSGTLATASIEVRAERPIGMVIPLFRKYTGI
ncbi:MAG TPA: NHLP bacteriocin system secretion protein [Gemmatimonadaceae bacterium]|nr:NHLP bacteriocin system secretion protein [Gemmatimonadaceae bacterium]